MFMDPALEAAIENAYVAFSDAKLGASLHVCRCPVCFDGDVKTEKALMRTPLREIPSAMLAEYTNSAHGWDDQMLYFLPRYLELIAQDDAPDHLCLETSLKRLSEVPWRETWPSGRVQAVEDFFAAYFLEQLEKTYLTVGHNQTYYDRSGMQDVLSLVILAGGDIRPLLAIWDAHQSMQAYRHLAALILEAGMRLYEGKLGWAMVENQPGIVDWMVHPQTRDRLEKAFFASVAEIDRNTFSVAVSLIENTVEQRRVAKA